MTLTSMRELAISAHGRVALTYPELNALRRTMVIPGCTLANGFLKNSDENTVVGFAAMAKALHDFGQEATAYGKWGVVGASRFVGRASSALAITRYEKQGPPSTSVHLIPQQSLHSLSGAVSVGLGLNGPNFGVGGGPNAVIEGLLTVLGTVDWELVPGMWLLMTEWDPEPIPDAQGVPTNAAVCHGIALAVTPTVSDETRPRLRIRVEPSLPESQAIASSCDLPIRSFWEAVEQITASTKNPASKSWTHQLEWGAVLELAP